METQWIDIKGYESIYQINSSGQVRRLPKKNVLMPILQKNGYFGFSFSRSGKVKRLNLHRLLASTFLDNPKNLSQVNHKDANKQNNSLDNLEWCSPAENISHARKLGLMELPKGEDNHNSKLTWPQVEEIRKLSGELSQRRLAKLFNVSSTTVRRIAQNRIWLTRK